MRLDVPPGPPPTTPPKDSTNPNDRATTFQAVEGGEQHSGAVLLVEAYAAIWLFLLAFVLVQWRRQATLHARLDELEGVIDRAASKLEQGSVQAKKPAPVEPEPEPTEEPALGDAAAKEA